MLNAIFSQKLNTQSKTVNNAVITLGDTDDTGKGRKFKSRFIQPGIAGYPGQFGNVLIRKETLDKFINTLVGSPVIINHKNLTVKNAGENRVGVVSSVWYDNKDGWYWCDGVIWDKTAQNLIADKGWSVSCSYDVTLADDAGGTENNIKYDMEFLNGVFTHLAIVNNPRYERANIVLNSKAICNGGSGSGNYNHAGIPGQVGGSTKRGVVDLTNYFPSNPTMQDVKDFLNEALKQSKEFATANPDWFIDIPQASKKRSHIAYSSEYSKMNKAQKNRHNKYIIALEDILENANYIEEAPNYKSNEKPNTELYHYFDSLIKIGNKQYKLIIDTEQFFGDSTVKPQTVHLYDIREVKNSSSSTNFLGSSNLKEESGNIINDISEDFNPNVTNYEQKRKKEMEVLDKIKELVLNVDNNCEVDNDRWITIHPHGEDGKGRHLLLQDGETPKEAIDRVYKKSDKSEKSEKEAKIQKAKEYDEKNPVINKYIKVFGNRDARDNLLKKIGEQGKNKDYYNRKISKIIDLRNSLLRGGIHTAEEYEELGKRIVDLGQQLQDDDTFELGRDILHYSEELESENWEPPKPPKQLAFDFTRKIQNSLKAIIDSYARGEIEKSKNDLVVLKGLEKILCEYYCCNEVNNGWVTLDKTDEDGNKIRVFINGYESPYEVKWFKKDIEEYAKTQKMKISLNGLDSKVSNNIIETINNALSEYKIKDIVSVSTGSLSRAYAFNLNNKDYNAIRVSKNLFSDFEDLKKRWTNDCNKLFHPEGLKDVDPIAGIITHELGHSITSAGGTTEFWDEIQGIIKEHNKELGCSTFRAFKKDKDKLNLKNFLSGYALYNQYEFVAEAFSDAKLSPNPCKYSKDVLKCIDKHFKLSSKETKQLRLFNAIMEILNMKDTVNNSKPETEETSEDDIWMEHYGLGYPTLEGFEEWEKEQEKLRKQQNK